MNEHATTYAIPTSALDELVIPSDQLRYVGEKPGPCATRVWQLLEPYRTSPLPTEPAEEGEA